MGLKKYNNLITSGRWSTKYRKGAQILDLVGVLYKIMAENKKSIEKSDRSNRDSIPPTKGETDYTRERHRNVDRKEYWK